MRIPPGNEHPREAETKLLQMTLDSSIWAQKRMHNQQNSPTCRPHLCWTVLLSRALIITVFPLFSFHYLLSSAVIKRAAVFNKQEMAGIVEIKHTRVNSEAHGHADTTAYAMQTDEWQKK